MLIAYAAFRTVSKVTRALGGVGGAQSVPLRQIRVDEILSEAKGKRPNPRTYLSKTYIDKHLSEFRSGVTKIYPTAPSGTAGPPGGTFVFPSSDVDDIVRQANGSVSKLEELLGLEQGKLGTNPIRIDISNPKGLRMPSGNERGANDYWIPGGYTSGGIMEAVVDSPVDGEYTVKPVF